MNNLKSKLEALKYIVSIMVGIILVGFMVYFLTRDNKADVYAQYTDITSESSTEDDVSLLFDRKKHPEKYESINQKEYNYSNPLSKAQKRTDKAAGLEGNTSVNGFEVHYIDVGQGDCTLIRCGNHAMMIDGGDNNVGTLIQKYLSDQGITYLDYVISTHGDADHCGSLDVVVTKFDCGTVLCGPKRKGTRTEEDFYDAIEYKGYSYATPQIGDAFYLGDALCEVVGPVSYDTEDVNDSSIVIKVTYSGNTFLFMGDAGEEEEYSILNRGVNVKADVLKLGHHGSNTSSSDTFLNEVSPTVAVISCSRGNDYGHPHPSVLNYLRKHGIETYRTDESGTLVVTVDNGNLTWNVSPSYTWLTGFDYQ